MDHNDAVYTGAACDLTACTYPMKTPLATCSDLCELGALLVFRGMKSTCENALGRDFTFQRAAGCGQIWRLNSGCGGEVAWIRLEHCPLIKPNGTTTC